jgi:flagellar hook-basal body complex protein FliE
VNNVTIDSVLAQMRALSEAAKSTPSADSAPAAEGPEFSRLLKNSLDQVNGLQSNASEMKAAFELGESDVSLPEVMVAVQKASISFEAVTQVRNRLLSAYQEIMNMQV